MAKAKKKGQTKGISVKPKQKNKHLSRTKSGPEEYTIRHYPTQQPDKEQKTEQKKPLDEKTTVLETKLYFYAPVFRAIKVLFWAYIFIFTVYLLMSAVVTIDKKLGIIPAILHVMIAIASAATAMMISRKLLKAVHEPNQQIAKEAADLWNTRCVCTAVVVLVALSIVIQEAYFKAMIDLAFALPFIIPTFLYHNIMFLVSPAEATSGTLSILPRFFSGIPATLQFLYFAAIVNSMCMIKKRLWKKEKEE
jgi:hypothetical protein